MPSDEPEKGDQVSWNWGSGAPGGTVAEKKTEGEVAITSKRGNKIKKNAEPDNPAFHIERSGNDVVKKASELNVEKKANVGANGSGAKRKHDEDGEKDEGPLEENAEGKTIKAHEGNKKQKKEAPAAEKKKAGRPKGRANGASAKAKKDAKPRATEGVGSRTRSRQK